LTKGDVITQLGVGPPLLSEKGSEVEDAWSKRIWHTVFPASQYNGFPKAMLVSCTWALDAKKHNDSQLLSDSGVQRIEDLMLDIFVHSDQLFNLTALSKLSTQISARLVEFFTPLDKQKMVDEINNILDSNWPEKEQYLKKGDKLLQTINNTCYEAVQSCLQSHQLVIDNFGAQPNFKAKWLGRITKKRIMKQYEGRLKRAISEIKIAKDAEETSELDKTALHFYDVIQNWMYQQEEELSNELLLSNDSKVHESKGKERLEAAEETTSEEVEPLEETNEQEDDNVVAVEKPESDNDVAGVFSDNDQGAGEEMAQPSLSEELGSQARWEDAFSLIKARHKSLQDDAIEEWVKQLVFEDALEALEGLEAKEWVYFFNSLEISMPSGVIFSLRAALCDPKAEGACPLEPLSSTQSKWEAAFSSIKTRHKNLRDDSLPEWVNKFVLEEVLECLQGRHVNEWIGLISCLDLGITRGVILSLHNALTP